MCLEHRKHVRDHAIMSATSSTERKMGFVMMKNVQKFMLLRFYFGIPSMMVEGVGIKCHKIKIKFEISSKGFFRQLKVFLK